MKKPFETYNGGKGANGVHQQIINHIPQCGLFIDAMVGNGSIFLNLSLPRLTIINDIDRNVIAKYDVSGSKTEILKYNTTYSWLIVQYDGMPGVFFYFDPPYHFDVRKSKQALYNTEWNHDEHVDFLEQCIMVKSNCMISHYPCELYDEMLKGWYTHDFQATTRNGVRTERIYMNYPPPVILQDFRYLGKNYRERQRIKRKIERHLSKLESLPADERTAILSSITVKYSATAERFINSATPLTTILESTDFARASSKKELLAIDTFLTDKTR
ncbi:hypothetical protein [Pedobacter miscanthi]|uniref:hypothetical protein n=1 Tax=Pedobacter miscanthi TaxID=2259170 RepID=UPI00293127C2|nr:hypothetical protein [Pedobacter miscanthi]